MLDWLSWAEVLEALQIKDSELLELFQKGLQLYKPCGREKIYCPDEHHRYFQASSLRLEKIGPESMRLRNLENPDKQDIKDLKKLEELKLSLEEEMRTFSARDPNVKRDHEKLSWEFFNPPNTEEGIEKLIHDLDLENAILKRDNVEEIRRTFGLGDPKKIQDKISERSENLKAVFPCEPGAKWESVKITLVSDYTVDIITPRGRGRFSYRELGMADNRTRDKKPGLLWKLFILFAKNHGLISSQESEYDPRLPDTAKRLNKHLQNLSDIQESIFTGHYKAEKAYRTKIFFSDQT
jgi:hypothetical protein